jgi:ribosomal protein L40E
MDILNKTKSFLTRTAKDAVRVSGELAYQTKLKLKAIEIKDSIKSKYTEIGELYFGAVEYELDNSEKIHILVEEIKSLKEDLEEIEEEIVISKKTKKCSVCDAENPVEADYCSKCGNGLR